jgi:hypothetical protein
VKAPSFRRAMLPVVAMLLLQAATLGPASAKARQFAVVLHMRQPDGREELISVSDFRFVWYDRRFVHHSTGFGKPGELEVRDLPEEVRSLQNEELDKIKFSKIRRVNFEYHEDRGKYLLHLIAVPLARHKKSVDWPGYRLRNASSASVPHFRGIVNGITTDFPLPPYLESESPDRPRLTEIDFRPPAAAHHP